MMALIIAPSANRPRKTMRHPLKKRIGFLSGCLIVFLGLFALGAIMSAIIQAIRDQNTQSSSHTNSPAPSYIPRESPSSNATPSDLVAKGLAYEIEKHIKVL